jgi:RNA polymerase sigma-70 factor (sigma-E family)
LGVVIGRRSLTLEEIYLDEYVALLRLAWALSGTTAAAEDLVQDVFVSAQRHWDDLRVHDAPGAWLRHALINCARSRWRRTASEQRALRKRGEPDPALTISEPTHELWQAVRRLSRRQREVIVLVYLEDRTVADAAQILGCSEDTARTHQRRALARLARDLDEEQQ